MPQKKARDRDGKLCAFSPQILLSASLARAENHCTALAVEKK